MTGERQKYRDTMLRNYFLLLSILSTIGLFSCEEPLELEVNEDARLVVISHFTQEKDLQVYVSKTKSVQDTKDAEFVTNATVMVFTGNELVEILELVSDSGQPFYKSKNLAPIIGETYTIIVSAPGFTSVTATSSIPATVPIQSVDFSPVFKGRGTNDLSINFKIAVTFSDPVEIRNFYHLVFYQELQSYSLDSNGDTILSPNVTLVRPQRIDLDNASQPLVKHFDNGSFLIKDESFNGSKVTFYLNGDYSLNASQYIPGNFLVELRSVSEAYYNYHLSITRQSNPKNGPLSEGVYVDDNIENGEGIFAGYSTSVNSSDLGD